MTIKQYGGVFGRNPTFNNVTIEGTLTFDGDIDINSDLTISGNLYLPDNSKAIFGNNDDLQIYHDGTDSIIEDVGTGNLDIKTNGTYILLRNTDGNNLAYFETGGGSHLYWNGASGLGRKLQTTATGIDVTGTVTADGLAVDGDGLLYSASNVEMRGDANVRISLGTAGTSGANNNSNWIYGNGTNLRFNNAGGYYSWETLGTERMRIESDGNVRINESLDNITGTLTLNGRNTGNIIFQSGGAEKMRIASSGFVGIGTSSPASALELSGAATANARLTLSQTTAGLSSQIQQGSTGLAISAVGSQPILLDTNGAEAMRIDASGNLQIAGTGVGNNSNTITFKNGAVAIAREDNNLRLHGFDNMIFGVSGTSYPVSTERMRIDASGNVGIGTNSPSNYNSAFNDLVVAGSGDSGITVVSGTSSEGSIAFADGTSGADAYRGWVNYNHNSNFMRFSTNAIERMRIDSSGNLLLGKTSSANAQTTVGHLLLPDGRHYATASGGPSGIFSRTTSDGDILSFYQGSTPTLVGSIGTESGYLAVGSPNGQSGYLGFRSNMVYPSTSTGGNRDDIIDLGGSSQRFDDIYATNGTIQTSDRNEKQDIEVLSDAEQRVAVAAKGLLRKFRWISSVEENGDDARIHFGIIAQDLQAAFAAEGLDAGDYAMFIHTTWTDEETGEERSRMGVRYSELLAFIIAAI